MLDVVIILIIIEVFIITPKHQAIWVFLPWLNQSPGLLGKLNLEKAPGGSSQGTLWTLIASWFRDHQRAKQEKAQKFMNTENQWWTAQRDLWHCLFAAFTFFHVSFAFDKSEPQSGKCKCETRFESENLRWISIWISPLLRSFRRCRQRLLRESHFDANSLLRGDKITFAVHFILHF